MGLVDGDKSFARNSSSSMTTTTTTAAAEETDQCAAFMSLDIFNLQKIALLSTPQIQRLMSWVELNCDLLKPNVWQIKAAHRTTFLGFFALFGTQILIGVGSHLWLLATISRDFLCDESWQAHIPRQRFYIVNVVLSDLFKLCFVLPVFAAVIFLQNFRLGQTMCYSLTMLQYFPIHATVFTYLAAARTHYKLCTRPDAGQPPSIVVCCCIWILSVLLSLPYTACMEYLELGELLNADYAGIGICYTNEQAEVPRFLRITFLLLFAAPLLVTYRLLSSSFWQIRARLEVLRNDARVENISSDWEALTLCRTVRQRGAAAAAGGGGHQTNAVHTATATNNTALPSPWQYQQQEPLSMHVKQMLLSRYEDSRMYACEGEIRSWRAQLFLNCLWKRSFRTFSLCFVPLYALILAMNWIKETQTASFTIDIIYLVFVFLAECSACTMPFYYYAYRKSILQERRKYEQIDMIRADEVAGKVRELCV